ncbi:MAG: hypothetical protein V8S72_08095 [Oscillospiraceae bacterium]
MSRQNCGKRHIDSGGAVPADILQFFFRCVIGVDAGGDGNNAVQRRTQLLRSALGDQIILVCGNGRHPAIAAEFPAPQRRARNRQHNSANMGPLSAGQDGLTILSDPQQMQAYGCPSASGRKSQLPIR